MVLVQLTVCRVMVDFPDHVPRLLIDDVLLHEEVLRRAYRMLFAAQQRLERCGRKC